MDKRYQVFISSTFTDLQVERTKVQQAVMELECIPAGMEAFPAIDEEQFEFIKRVIDDCDYYLLVIGGRYGSVSEEVGLSYTEMEYDYAVSKGIKVIVFLHQDPDSLPVRKSEQSEESKKKLKAFRDKVSTGRLVRFWNNADELPGLVSTSLSKTIRTYPAVGWVRGNLVPNSSLYKELNDLRKENDRLNKLLGQQSDFTHNYDIASLSDSIKIEAEYSLRIGQGNMGQTIESPRQIVVIDTTWGEIFSAIASKLLVHVEESTVSSLVSMHLIRAYITKDEISFCYLVGPAIERIRIQLRALGLVNLTPADIPSRGGGRRALVWSLTPLGEKTLLIERSIKKASILKPEE
jgi:hypothetical protein